MTDPWYILRLAPGPRNPALPTLSRLRIPYWYPTARIRRPRKPDLVQPLLPGYCLISFDPSQRIVYHFADGARSLPWQAFNEFPGVVRIFNDGTKPLPITEALSSALMAPVAEPCAAGNSLRVKSGPFAGFMALVSAAEAGSVQAWVTLFGRASLVSFTEDQLEAA